jgi:flagella basal body P-ring formation protein FlgA
MDNLARHLQATRYMKRTTKYRRMGLIAAVLFGAYAPAHAQNVAAETEVAGTTPVSQTESLAAIRTAAESYVKSLLPPGPGENTVTVGALDNRLRFARCPSSELSASLPAGMALQARSTVGVTCAGPVHWTVYLPVTVESTIDVLVLAHAVNRDARLMPGDVRIERRRTTGPANLYLTSAAELSGRTARRPLAAGTTLAVDMFTADLIVRRGQQVTLLSSGGMIEVRATGRAMADGAEGARIQVQNLSSMRVIEGVIESADLVRVAY